MAIVKANYVKRGERSRGRAKATIRYIQERPGNKGEKLTRTLFGSDGSLTIEQAYRMIDEAAQHTLFYRLVISPDPRREDALRDLDLAELTKQTVAELENRLKTQILFAAALHDDHTPHRHVHVLALIKRKLSRGDIDFLRTSATQATLIQRRLRDLAFDRKLSSKLKLTRAAPGRGALRRRNGAGVYAAPPSRTKVSCRTCSEGSGVPMEKISARLHKCASCGIVIRQTGIGLQIEHTGGPDLSLNL